MTHSHIVSPVKKKSNLRRGGGETSSIHCSLIQSTSLAKNRGQPPSLSLSLSSDFGLTLKEALMDASPAAAAAGAEDRLGMGGPSSLASSIGQSKDKKGTIGSGSE